MIDVIAKLIDAGEVNTVVLGKSDTLGYFCTVYCRTVKDSGGHGPTLDEAIRNAVQNVNRKRMLRFMPKG